MLDERAVYNEIAPYPAEWLRNLAAAGLVCPGRVDERSIAELEPEDVAGSTQFHTFAGIGLWSHALRLAGWPDDCEVWTGSCPCQPFSSAGKRAGFDDPRHLWPEWRRLIAECRPPVVFGEQVAGKDGLAWLDVVSADLEALGYAVGFACLPACSVGAPHKRERLWLVAYTDGQRLERVRLQLRERRQDAAVPEVAGCGEVDGVGDADGIGRQRRMHGATEAPGGGTAEGAVHALGGFWSDAEWIPCRDGKFRAAKSFGC